MIELIFATNNKHKVEEAKAKINSQINIISLNDIDFHEDIEETETTIEGNAKLKADYIFNRLHRNCFADDTGLEVEALNGAPGVYSSRFAGLHVTYEENVNKLLHDLSGISNRQARFRTSIHLILNGKHYSFEGIVNGKITETPCGVGGFGYDPIFMPDGFNVTFAELPLDVKNAISHRGLALEKMGKFLNSI